MNLVVGATGQVGSKIVLRLRAQGRPVRAFVRHDSANRGLERAGTALAFGDLRDASSVAEACEGVDAVIATANTVGPRGSYSFRSVEGGWLSQPGRSGQAVGSPAVLLPFGARHPDR